MMAQHEIIPSFATEKANGVVPTYTLAWNAKRQRYEISLTDKNGYAFPLQIKEPFYVEKNGNQ